MPYVVIYILAALLVASMGIDRKFGFWGYFFGTICPP